VRGDILLFTATSSLADRLIAYFTQGPFVHVEVDLGDGTSIGAHRDGVKLHPLAAETAFRRVSPRTAARIELGIHFLQGELGNGYGFIDIINQVLKVLRSPVFLAARDQYDCSDLVARYILVTDALELGELGEEPHMVTPNDIARACGLC
jgi:hypothetical protein